MTDNKHDSPPNFRGEDGKLFLVRCPSCNKENWSPAVATGECAWCGWGEKEALKKWQDNVQKVVSADLLRQKELKK